MQEDLLNRHDKIQRLNRSTATEIRNSNPFAVVGLVAIGMILGMVILGTVKACDREVEPVAAQVGCRECHGPAPLNTYAKYAKYCKLPPEGKVRYLAELERTQ